MTEQTEPLPETDLPKDLAAIGLESWVPVKLHRSKLKGAPYNPRVIGEAQRRKLRAGLKRHGLVEPIVWNERTGNIVGGHQRISQIDTLAGTSNYELTVARIDVDENREKELNLLLNNDNAQGDFNMELLAELVKTPDIVLDGTGFDHADLFRLFGDTPILARNDNLDALAEKVRAAQQRYDQVKKDNKKTNSTEFYIVVVFRDAEECSRFLALNELEDHRYQSGETLAAKLGILERMKEPPAE